MFSWQNPSQTFYFFETCDWFRNMHTSVESQWPICPLNNIFGGECNCKCGSAGQCVREGNAVLKHGSDVHPTAIPVTQVFVHPGLHHWLEYASKQFRGNLEILSVPSLSMKLTHTWFLNGFHIQFETASLFRVKFCLLFHGPEKENELLKKESDSSLC